MNTLLNLATDEIGLHSKEVKKLLADRNRFDKNCDELLESDKTVLNAFLKASVARARRAGARPSSYRLQRPSSTTAPVREELRLERAIWLRWRPQQENKNIPAFIEHYIQYVVAYQVPLFSAQDKGGLGYVDLLGVSESMEPVVIELKAAESKESPLRMLLEAACYAVVLREVWNKLGGQAGTLAQQWQQALKDAGLSDSTKSTTLSKPLVIACVAPAAYWRYERDVQYHPGFANVVDALNKSHGLKAIFANLTFETAPFTLSPVSTP